MRQLSYEGFEALHYLRELKDENPNAVVYFKVRDGADVHELLNERKEVIALIEHNAVIFFTVCFTPLLESVDEQDHQYWRFVLAGLDDESKVQVGMWALAVMSHTKTPTPKTKRGGARLNKEKTRLH